MMRIFRKKSRAKRTEADANPIERIRLQWPGNDSNRQQRSKIDEKILRDGPDKGFVWHEEDRDGCE